jgi:hypothetical protein
MVNFVWYKINFLSELRLLSTILALLYDYTIIQSQYQRQLISVGLANFPFLWQAFAIRKLRFK